MDKRIFMLLATGTVIGGIVAIFGNQHHKPNAAELKLAGHCELMTIDVNDIDRMIDRPRVRDIAASLYNNLATNNFRELRLCTSDAPFAFCGGENFSAECVHKGIAEIRAAWVKL